MIRFIDEYPGAGRLGRHVEHDPRSLAYALSEDLLPSTYTSATHTVRIGVLDQAALGSCTGNAAEALAGTDPLYDAIPAKTATRPTGDPVRDEQQAVALYSAATRLDSIRGNYPPTDTGSTGLAVAKAAQKAGLISGYQHALSLDATLKALTATPLIVGVNWYEGFDTPDSAGLVHVSGSVRGGHEFLLYGIDATANTVLARNSWGTDWGAAGCFSFSFDDLGRLLDEDGDATLFVPLTSPAPTPTPTPTPVDVDQALATAARTWLAAKGL
ncbi:hypothetical protein CG740_37275 [Streptomyces sp. CB01201]|uniref:C1 family peptidase n=1 Tax=Streptomyces sp. CB01201 TaxID=2020324 RepID=UPI000C27C55C|nr:C1 family peptidase [Streptomyces sp. CB01201]PJM98138.1 hypothetical protein CG740_37275 [Streptomyces sp. CB01201]